MSVEKKIANAFLLSSDVVDHLAEDDEWAQGFYHAFWRIAVAMGFPDTPLKPTSEVLHGYFKEKGKVITTMEEYAESRARMIRQSREYTRRKQQRLQKALILGLCRIAAIVAIYETVRTSLPPPNTCLSPRNPPLSR